MKAIIFDLDGTLLNTLDDLTASTNYALTTFGYPTRSIDEVRGFVGNGVRLLISRALPDFAKDKTDECLKVFQAHYSAHSLDLTRPYDGIPEMLESLNGCKTAICSNKYDEAVQSLKNSFFPTVTAAFGLTDGISPKPAPDMLYKAIAALGVNKNEVVYVGDSDVDMQTAANTGLRVIAVTWGFRSADVLRSYKPNAIIDHPDELIAAASSLV